MIFAIAARRKLDWCSSAAMFVSGIPRNSESQTDQRRQTISTDLHKVACILHKYAKAVKHA
jgi:hypothetical protein